MSPWFWIRYQYWRLHLRVFGLRRFMAHLAEGERRWRSYQQDGRWPD
jgi:hypothetical protein